MAVSQNGYLANDRSVITRYSVSDSGLYMNLRKGSPGELLAHFVRWFDKNIRDIDPGILDDWSYAERPIRGGTELSNHASGTAADVDATKWPLGVEPSAYLTADEIARVRERLKFYEGCIRWGGDYTGRKDPMHFEINRDQATCDRVWAKIQNDPEDDMTPEQAQQLKDIHHMLVPKGGYGGPPGDVISKIGALQSVTGAVQAGMAALLARDPSIEIDAADLAAIVPDDIAQKVVDLLGARIAS